MPPNLISVWRNRGFNDAIAEKPRDEAAARDRGGDKAERAYRQGYQTGLEQLERRTRADLPVGTQEWGRRAI